jgi:hypothetical protein
MAGNEGVAAKSERNLFASVSQTSGCQFGRQQGPEHGVALIQKLRRSIDPKRGHYLRFFQKVWQIF